MDSAVRRFHFANAFWFRVPVKVLVLTVSVFGLLTLWPALSAGTEDEYQRAIFGLMVVIMFVTIASTFAVAINDSIVEVDDRTLYVRFEAFFEMEVPLADVVAARIIDPHPRWRYRFGLSTNFRDRIACSHGGRLVEVRLRKAWTTRLWPRRIEVSRLWLAVTEPDMLIAALTAATEAAAQPVADTRKAA